MPYVLAGSGFMVDKNGFFITAAHVTFGLYNTYEKLKKEGIRTTAKIFLANETETESQLIAQKIGMGFELPKITYSDKNNSHDLDIDMYVGRVEGNEKYTFLNFDKPTKINPLDHVIMCGYPMISQSIILNSKTSNRWSSLAQPGVISSLLPTDESLNPYGIQTDIVGTGGSSGSPIVDSKTSQVLGIAQKVLTAEISNSDKTAKIGLTYGISNYYVSSALPSIIKQIKNDIDSDGKPKKHLKPNSPVTVTNQDIHFSDIYKQK